MRYIILTLLISVSFSVQAENTRFNSMYEEMVRFDQAFIPVYFHVKYKNLTEARKAILPLRFRWNKLKNKYEYLVEEAAWQDAFCRADEWMDQAIDLIHENEAEMAFIQLSQVQFEMSQLRKCYELPYYLDKVYRFQELAQTLSEILHDEKLYLLEWGMIEQYVGQMNSSWISLRRHSMDPKDFNLTFAERKVLQATKVSIARELIFFNDLLAEAHQIKLRVAIKRLEREADTLLMLFGHYKPTDTYIATL